jgi:hypothetical protein
VTENGAIPAVLVKLGATSVLKMDDFELWQVPGVVR